MKKLLFILLAIPLLFFSCEKESGQLFDDSLSNPAYSADIIETVWSSKISFSEDDEGSIYQVNMSDDLILSRSTNEIHVHSAETGEFLWSIPKNWDGSQLGQDAMVLGNQVYFYHNKFRDNAVWGINKQTGEIKNQIFLNDFDEIKGSFVNHLFHGNSIYLLTYKPNKTFLDYDDFSFFIYKYNLVENELSLLFENTGVYRLSSQYLSDLVVNNEGTALYYPYLMKTGEEQFEMEVVEILLDQKSAQIVVRDHFNADLRFNFIRGNTFTVSDDLLLINFYQTVDSSLRVYDLSRDGEFLWKRNSSRIPQVHQGGLYLIVQHNTGSMQKIDLNTGIKLWDFPKSVVLDGFDFVGGKPLGVFVNRDRNSFSILDLNSGNVLLEVFIEDLDIEQLDNRFVRNIFSYKDGKHLIVTTRVGEILFLELPF
ncbi:MAG: hypothetical protein EA362_05425 [Saprospirales bacterium]|nr:MAG: hypothetical protein EA362_05425 [Saprospirales bacterium]